MTETTEKYEIRRGEFGWAVEEMRRGRSLRRPVYADNGRVWLKDGHIFAVTDGKASVREAFTTEEILAEDWEHYDAAD